MTIPSTAAATEDPAGATVSQRQVARYLALLLAISAVLYLFPFVGERMPGLRDWVCTPFASTLDAAYSVTGPPADIVIFGDSAALYGVDTPAMSRDLGLRTINLPNTQGSLPVTRDQPLAMYLATHRAPRLIVLYFMPWDIDAMDTPDALNPQAYEGEEQVIRNGSARSVLTLLRHRTEDTLVFPMRLYSTHGRVTELLHPNRKRETVMQGFRPYQPGYPAVTGPCPFQMFFGERAKIATGNTLEALVRHYTTPSTRVAVYLAPLPACEGAAEIQARQFPPLGTVPPAILPEEDFANDGRFAHMLSTSAGKSTALLEARVRAWLR